MHDLAKKKENKTHMKWSDFKRLTEDDLKKVFEEFDAITIHTINGVFVKITKVEL